MTHSIFPFKDLSGSSKNFHVLINRGNGFQKYDVHILKEGVPEWFNASLGGTGKMGIIYLTSH